MQDIELAMVSQGVTERIYNLLAVGLFGHVGRFGEGVGFYGANDARREGRPLDNGWKIDPPI